MKDISIVPKDVVKSVLRDFVTMNKAALTYTEFLRYLDTLSNTDAITVGDIRAKLVKLEEEAMKRLETYAKVLELQEEK